ncbi:hypothetical protein ZHAS_00005249 [Anopheles sinensis]|uniref:Uncharacterized protein n=1 Tax=Anopheles sinensis TaxID=74873 RepID=A0A084VIY2_ANOSI|nr:hypothetical protein ZHAS_00005249 [Anopheles sinensis]
MAGPSGGPDGSSYDRPTNRRPAFDHQRRGLRAPTTQRFCYVVLRLGQSRFTNRRITREFGFVMDVLICRTWLEPV